MSGLAYSRLNPAWRATFQPRHHHGVRAELIDALIGKAPTRKPGIVMEYLDRGTRLDPQRPLLEEMQQAGFNAQGWQWPLHEPLFAVARAAGLDILGAI
jgi:hypothetical protein